MPNQTPELKRIVQDVVGPVASSLLMGRIFAALDESRDIRTAATKVEKLVSLFLGSDLGRELGAAFQRVLA